MDDARLCQDPVLGGNPPTCLGEQLVLVVHLNHPLLHPLGLAKPPACASSNKDE